MELEREKKKGVFFIAPIIIGAYLSNSFNLLGENATIPLSIFQILLLTSVLGFFFNRLKLRSFEVDFTGLELRHLVFITIIFFSLIYSPEREQGVFYAIRFSVLLCMSLFIYNVVNSISEIKILVLIVIIVSLVVAIQGIVEIYFNPEIVTFNYLNEGKKLIRANGSGTDANIFASGLLMPCFILIAYAGQKPEIWKKIALFSLLMIFITSIVLTYSRSAWVALIIGGTLILINQKKFHFFYFMIFSITVVLLFSETARSLLGSVFIRFKDIFSGTEDDSSNVRIMLLMGAIKMFFDSYGLGVGFQGFSTKFLDYYTTQQTIGVYEPHNEFYTVLAELGIIGFTVFIYLIYGYLKTGILTLKISSNYLSIGLFTTLIGYLIFYQFYGGMIYNSLFFINLSLLLSLRKVYAKSILSNYQEAYF